MRLLGRARTSRAARISRGPARRPSSARAASRERGFQLVELLVASSILAALAAVGIPPLLRTSAGLRVQLAAGEVAGAFRTCQAFALRLDTNVAAKFRTADDGEVTFTLYRDGDGDGVLTKDIDSGVDPQVAPARRLSHLGRHIGFGFPPGPAPTDPGDPSRRLGNLDDPIRFNNSDLASFSPLGGSTPGSAYLTDHLHHLAVARVFGRTGKVEVLTYDPETETWH